MPKTQPKNRPGRPETIDWKKYDHLLGKASDIAIARLIGGGCTSTAALKRRRKLGIAAVRARWGELTLPTKR